MKSVITFHHFSSLFITFHHFSFFLFFSDLDLFQFIKLETEKSFLGNWDTLEIFWLSTYRINIKEGVRIWNTKILPFILSPTYKKKDLTLFEVSFLEFTCKQAKTPSQIEI